MPPFANPDAQLLLIDSAAAAMLMNTQDVMAAVREAFVLHSSQDGRVFPMVRQQLPQGVWGIKSGDVPGQGLLGFKTAGYWPGNREREADPHQATVLLIDPATGRPVCIIDGNEITTMRTGAAGALGLLQLARAESTRICVFGTGVQARIQLHYALEVMPSLTDIDYITSHGGPDPAFEQLFKGRAAVARAFDRNAAVGVADIIITATPANGALFALEAVKSGTHINCVGADTQGKRELPEGLLRRARLFVDDYIQARQIGELQWAPELACMQLGELLSGHQHAHRLDPEITIFDMTGIALQDLTVARMIYERAQSRGAGLRVDWPW